MNFFKKSTVAYITAVITLICLVPASAFGSYGNLCDDGIGQISSEIDYSIFDTCAKSTEQEAEELKNDPRSAFLKDYIEGNSVDVQLFAEESESEYGDVSHMSDEEFFGLWNAETEEWDICGKLDYSYSEELQEVERLVKLNSYSLAKDALLEYYKNRTGIQRPDFDSSISWHDNILNMRDAFTFTEERVITLANITNATDEYQEYTIDLLGSVSHGVFMLTSINKTDDMIEIASRESEYSPSLLILKSDGTQVTLLPNKDTYIRGWDTEADYRNEIYGDSQKLYVKDSYTDNGDGTYKPYGSKTRRTYISFDADQIPKDATRMYLTIYAKIVPEEGVEETTEDSLELVIMGAYNKSWDEVESPDNQFSPMNWKNYRQVHYSWNGLPGGFDYKVPDNVNSEWFNYNTRFNDIVSLAKSTLLSGNPDYIKKSLSNLLDFISDTNGLIETANVPAGRDLESKFRLASSPGLIATYLEADMLNGNTLTSILKWMWEEMTYMYNGAGCLYTGANCEPQTNNYAETNRGFWHCEAMETICAYYPEYADREMWKQLADERLETVTNVIINDDGCYQEATFSYAISMLLDYIDLWNELEGTGEYVPDWYKEKVEKFAQYIMNVSFPNHVPPKYGEGMAGSSVNALNNYLTLVDDDAVRFVATDGQEGFEPDYTSKYFEKLQMAACRTNWTTDASMLLMSAKNGGNHNHKDSLHMMYYYDGMDLLADTGMTSYDGFHPHFQFQRHYTRSHNTIEIDGTPQRGSDYLYNDSEDESKWNGFSKLDLYTSEPVDRIVAWTDANKGFRHYRNVSYIKNHDFLIVSDMVKPEDDEVHTYTQNWHTSATEPSNPVIDNFTKTGKTNYHSRANIIITQANTDGVDLSLESGYSIDSPKPTEYFCYTQKKSGPVMYNTVICPTSIGSSIDVNVQNIETGVDPAIASAMNVNIFKNNDDVVNVFYYNSFEDVPTERTFDGYTTNSSNVTLQTDVDGIPSYLSMYNGSVVTREGNEIIVSDAVVEDIEVVFDGTNAVITSKDENINNAKLVIATPYKIKNVTINGKATDFVWNNNKIYINNNELVNFSENSGYIARLSAKDGDKEYVIFADVPDNSVTEGALKEPVVAYKDGVVSIELGNAVLCSSAKITVKGHSGKSASVTIDGNKKAITGTLTVGSSREDADGYVTSGSPAVENAREDLVIWTKDAALLTVGAASGGSGGSGGGSGGSGSGSGSSYAPDVKPFPKGDEVVVAPPVDETTDLENSDDTATQKAVFEDCIGHWAQADIDYMHSMGYVNGISETEFAPDVNVTRAEFAAMAVRILGLDQEEYSGSFSDVSVSEWYAPVVQTAYNAGIILGSDGLFRPDDSITRQEMAVILMRIYKNNDNQTEEIKQLFADDSQIDGWASESVYSAVNAGLINGMGDGSFAPLGNTTRAQAATVFKRLLDTKRVKED